MTPTGSRTCGTIDVYKKYAIPSGLGENYRFAGFG